MGKPPPSPVEDQLRQLISEARGATKDLTVIIREARTVITASNQAQGDLARTIIEAFQGIDKEVHEIILGILDKQGEEVKKSVQLYVREAEARVRQKFEELQATLLAVGAGSSGATIPEIIEVIVNDPEGRNNIITSRAAGRDRFTFGAASHLPRPSQ